jgi:hypothetical protein
VKNQITRGNWVVRAVQHVDPAKRLIWFSAGGMYPGKDPYFANYYRINFDGSGLTRLTEADANHAAAFTSDLKYYVDTYSRTDTPPVMELRRTDDNTLVSTLERGDITELMRAGWKAPEVFVAKGRDGTTDIWGIIIRPGGFDPARKYPVIENIYAGPQGSFVPKSFFAYNQMQSQAELGFIVVQIDGMGTSNRSKAFHDVAWKNLGDAGFPDRILWHKAVAARYPFYDITRVGIYGGSAGGQNALGGLLFHSEFYKAGIAYAGCHDNRMDKIWWNEQWMGWPVGPQYSASSNVDNAHRLQGELLLVVGELDTNVDPSSTMQVVNQLIKHNKNFDLLVIPGANHPAGRGNDPTASYGDHKRFDFFVRHLLRVTPPPWNRTSAVSSDQAGFTCDLTTYTCAKTTDLVDEADEEVRNGPPRQPDPTRLPRTERFSPDRKFVAFVRDHNLWIRNAATGEQMPLSRDGEHFYDYATPLPSPTLMVGQGTEDVVQAPAVFWSPRLEEDCDLRDGSAQFPASDHHSVGAAGPVPSQVFQLCVSAAGRLDSAHREAGGLRRRAPQDTGRVDQIRPDADLKYRAHYVKAEKRYSHNTQFLMSYTYPRRAQAASTRSPSNVWMRRGMCRRRLQP